MRKKELETIITGYLNDNPDEFDDIERSVKIVQKKIRKNPNDTLDRMFEWQEIRISHQRIKKWILAGFVKIGYKSNKSTMYRFENIDLTEKIMTEYKITRDFIEKENHQRRNKKVEISDDIFDCIYGLDEFKQLITMALRADRQVHVCLWGPPATAKSLFLLEISKITDTYYAIGSSASKVGLTEVLMQNRPRILLIDEIDKLARNPDDLSVLLSLMETGLVKNTKHGKHGSVILDTKVIAAGNVNNLPIELSSRFLEFYLKEYNEKEFKEVVVYYLTHAEKTKKSFARYIADKIYRFSKDVRIARNIARMCETKDEVDVMVKLLKKYGDPNEQKN